MQIVTIFTMEEKSYPLKSNHELKEILRERKLKVSGKKTDLIDRYLFSRLFPHFIFVLSLYVVL